MMRESLRDEGLREPQRDPRRELRREPWCDVLRETLAPQQSVEAVLRRLRDGCDPATGDPLPPDHVCQRGDVVRALFVAVAAVEGQGRGDAEPAAREGLPRPVRPRPPNAGQPWSDDEDQRLAEAFDGGADERELAAAFGRSRVSIRARLLRLGRGALLDDGPAPRFPVAEVAGPLAEVGTSRDGAGD